MSLPVVVTRIQNRRGTQLQFDGYVYSPSGPNSVYPYGYTGVGGYGSFPDFNSTNYPNVLLPGELAFCTDSRKIFLGNLSGEYVEIAETTGTVIDDNFLAPTTWVLQPSPTFTPVTKTIPGPTTVTLDYDATPFFNIRYNITDTVSLDWNDAGTNFAKNGELQITAIVPPLSPPPPPFSPATLTDVGTDINLTLYDVSFIAQYNGAKIEILYMHNFLGPLVFNTNTLAWIPL